MNRLAEAIRSLGDSILTNIQAYVRKLEQNKAFQFILVATSLGTSGVLI